MGLLGKIFHKAKNFEEVSKGFEQKTEETKKKQENIDNNKSKLNILEKNLNSLYQQVNLQKNQLDNLNKKEIKQEKTVSKKTEELLKSKKTNPSSLEWKKEVKKKPLSKEEFRKKYGKKGANKPSSKVVGGKVGNLLKLSEEFATKATKLNEKTQEKLNDKNTNSLRGTIKLIADDYSKFFSKRWNELTTFFSDRKTLGKILTDLPYHTTLACLTTVCFIFTNEDKSQNEQWKDVKQSVADKLQPLNKFLANHWNLQFDLAIGKTKGTFEKFGEEIDKNIKEVGKEGEKFVKDLKKDIKNIL